MLFKKERNEAMGTEPALCLPPLRHSLAAILLAGATAGLALSFIGYRCVLCLPPPHISLVLPSPLSGVQACYFYISLPCCTILEMGQLSDASRGIFHIQTHSFPQSHTSHIII